MSQHKFKEKIEIPSKTIKLTNFIGSEKVFGNGDLQKVYSPYNGQIIGEFHHSTSEDVQRACEVAQEAFQLWKNYPLKERCSLMFNWRQKLLERIDEISHLISSECGKTLNESRAGVLKGIEVLEYALSLQNLDIGGKLQVSRGVFCEYRRIPLGIVGAITPFNFPAMVPMWMMPIAITLGNSFIWKPSDKTPLTSGLLFSTFKDAGFPPGVLNIVQGGQETAQALLDSPQIKALGFVGSTAVAKKVYQRGTSQGKRILALGGAKNHIILLPDANEELTTQGIVDSFTGCAGQRCMAASVLLAVGEVDSFIEKIKQKAQDKKLGLSMGAIITPEAREFLNDSIEKAKEQGAKVILDGRNVRAPKEYERGNWLAPTILDHVKPGEHAATTELFGPVLTIIRCKDLTEALAIEASSHYGNAASVFTSSGPMAERVCSEANAAMVGINIGVPVPREPFSFAGMNDSKFGQGEITGESSLDLWTHKKKITTKWMPQHDQNWMS